MDSASDIRHAPFQFESAADRRRRFAMSNAIALAYHGLADEPCLYREDLMPHLLGLSPEAVRALAPADSTFRLTRFYAAARSRFMDESAAAAVAAGIRQIVILDAGLTTFGYHLDVGPEVHIYETDIPSEQTWKRCRLADVGVKIPDSLHFVEADAAGLASALAAAGFRRGLPALFSWVGVVAATPLPDITTTFGYVGSCPGSRLIFDYLEPPADGSDAAAAFTGLGLEPDSAFMPQDAADLLHGNGFHKVYDQLWSELVSRFLRAPPPGTMPLGLHIIDART